MKPVTWAGQGREGERGRSERFWAREGRTMCGKGVSESCGEGWGDAGGQRSGERSRRSIGGWALGEAKIGRPGLGLEETTVWMQRETNISIILFIRRRL